VYSILGGQNKRPLPTEAIARKNARRSLVALSSIKKGTTITKEHLTYKRPAHGISPREIELVIGKKVVMDIIEDTVMQWNLLS
jgi:N-acetylneuraminate synthase